MAFELNSRDGSWKAGRVRGGGASSFLTDDNDDGDASRRNTFTRFGVHDDSEGDGGLLDADLAHTDGRTDLDAWLDGDIAALSKQAGVGRSSSQYSSQYSNHYDDPRLGMLQDDSDSEDDGQRVREKSEGARRRVDRRVVPVAWLILMASALEYGNLASVNAAMGESLALSEAQLAFAVTVFFIAAILFAFPATMMLRFVFAKYWLPSLTMLAAVTTACLNFVTRQWSLILARALLGTATNQASCHLNER